MMNWYGSTVLKVGKVGLVIKTRDLGFTLLLIYNNLRSLVS